MEVSETSSSSSAYDSDNGEISQLVEAVSKTGSFNDHLALLQALSKRDDLDAFRKARESFSRSHPLPESEWIEWVSDEEQLANTAEEQAYVLDLASRAVFDCPTVSVCNLRLQINASLSEVGHPKANVLAAFKDALWVGAAAHFKEGHHLWKEYCSSHPPQDVSPRPPLDSDSSDQVKECRIFESRLDTALSKDSVSNEDYVVSVFLSYASYATHTNIYSAVSIYERCVQMYKSNQSVWSAYYSFCTSVADADRRYYTARRAARACSTNLKMWSLMTREIVHATPRFISDRLQTLTEVIDVVRPIVMHSNELKDASHLCTSIWTVFQCLGGPKESLNLAKSALSFNVSGTTEWASALSFAATVCMECNYRDDGMQLFEQVIAERGQEARWWLAYANCTSKFESDAAAKIFARASTLVSDGICVDLIEDAWLAHEVSYGKERFSERISNVLRVMEERRARSGVTIFDEVPEVRGERQKRKRSSNWQGIKRPRRNVNEKEGAFLSEQPAEDMEIENAHERTETLLGESQNADSVKASEKGDGKDVSMAEDGNHIQDKLDSAKNSVKEDRKREDVNDGEVEPRTIYLNNVPFHAKEKDIRDAFESAGKIADVRLPRRSDGASKGIAYVEFEEDTSVDKAIENRHALILGRQVWVRRSQPRPKKGKHKGHGGARGRKRTVGAKTSRPERVRIVEDDHSKPGSILEEKVDEQSKTQADFRAMFL